MSNPFQHDPRDPADEPSDLEENYPDSIEDNYHWWDHRIDLSDQYPDPGQPGWMYPETGLVRCFTTAADRAWKHQRRMLGIDEVDFSLTAIARLLNVDAVALRAAFKMGYGGSAFRSGDDWRFPVSAMRPEILHSLKLFSLQWVLRHCDLHDKKRPCRVCEFVAGSIQRRVADSNAEQFEEYAEDVRCPTCGRYVDTAGSCEHCAAEGQPT